MRSRIVVWGVAFSVAGVLLFSLFTSEKNRGQSVEKEVDTIYVDRVFVDTVVIEKQSKPVKVLVYLPDTIRRRAVERDTIITDILLSRSELQLTRIAPNGLTIQSAYVLPELSGARVNHRGNVEIVVDERQDRKERRKRKLRKIVQVGAVVGGFVLGIVL